MTIELYTWNTPNGRKASIALEEFALPYSVHPINISKGEQHHPDFLRISPNNKIPAIVDPDGPDGKPMSLFESAAILIYLAEKTGRFMPRDTELRLQALEWLAWQMGNYGPMLGQAHHFRRFAAKPHPYAIERYSNESARLYNVLDRRLEGRDYLVGDYSIVDMATFPWSARHEWHGIELADYPNVKRWYDSVAARPAVQRGMALPG